MQAPFTTLTRAEKISLFHKRRIITIQKQAHVEFYIYHREPLFLLGLGLYWAEGFKKDHRVGICNTDPSIMRIFLVWCQKYLNVANEVLEPRISINTAHSMRVQEISDYWSKQLNLPLNIFRKPFYQKSVWQKSYTNPNDYYGVIRVYVKKSRHLLYKVCYWIEELKQQENILF